MAFNLEKNQSFNLTKATPSLSRIRVGLGWDEAVGGIDCDVSVFLLNTEYKIPTEGHLVFYNNLTSPCGSVIHEGDNRTGEGDGDDETVRITLETLDHSVAQALFVVTIHDAAAKGQNFGQIDNAYIQIYDDQTDAVLCRYDLAKEFSSVDSVSAGRVYRDGAEWTFQALGDGYNGGLQALIGIYHD